MTSEIDIHFLKRASLAGRGFTLWEHSAHIEVVNRLCGLGYLKAVPHEWGDGWMRYQITSTGERELANHEHSA